MWRALCVASVLGVASSVVAQVTAPDPDAAVALRARSEVELEAAPVPTDPVRVAFELAEVTDERQAIDLTGNHLLRGAGVVMVMLASMVWLAFGTIWVTGPDTPGGYPDFAERFGATFAGGIAGVTLGVVLMAIGEADGALHRRRALTRRMQRLRAVQVTLGVGGLVARF